MAKLAHETTGTGRLLGLYERFHLSRTLIGTPPIIVYAASLRQAPPVSALTTAVDKLLEQHPILQGTVPEPHTPHPRIELNTEIRASNIVQTGTLNASVSDILEHALTTGAGFNIRTGPLWGVNLLQAQQSAGATLVLSVHHATSDGLGAVSLLAELVRHINTAPTPSASNNQDLLLTLPPTIESTIDIRPGFLALIYVIFTELLVPLLPQALQPRKPAPYWPLPLSNSPIIYAPRVTHFKLSEELVNNLKNIGREHSVRTLHPLLHTIALFALQHTIDRTAATQVKTVTPMSERSSAAGHPSSTGNYVAGHTEFFNIAPTSDFWDLARLYAHSLADPKARQRARAELGMLTYVPNPEKMPEHNKSGWEVFFGGKLMGPEPLGASFELSNLGVVKEELEGVEEVVYAQMPSALGAALSINAIATKGGPLNITITWREGVVERSQVDQYVNTFTRVTELLAKNEIPEQSLFSNVANRI